MEHEEPKDGPEGTAESEPESGTEGPLGEVHAEGTEPASFASFGLHADILAGVEAAGFLAPRPIQVSAIPAALAGRDVLGLARTGTGKTAAFALPLLHRLVTVEAVSDSLRALVLAPTRELAQQIGADIEALGSAAGHQVALLIGGIKIERQREALRAGATIAVACTGRLMDLVEEKTVSLKEIEVLVLDEADRMVDMGFLPDVRRILKGISGERQTMMFSATMPEAIQALAQRILKAPEIIDLGNAAPPETIDHAILPVRSSAKTKLLLQILKGEGFNSAIVFVRTKARGKVLTFQLEKRGISVTLLHGDKKQGARGRALDGFKSGEFEVLVATDLASRGLDVDHVSHVINYDVPLDPDTYVHRIGRTGRSERKGIAYTLLSRGDLEPLRAIEHNIGARIERRFLEGFAELDDEYLIQKGSSGPRSRAKEKKPEFGKGSGEKKGGSRGAKSSKRGSRRRRR